MIQSQINKISTGCFPRAIYPEICGLNLNRQVVKVMAKDIRAE